MIWRASDVIEGEQYKVELCQSESGKRSLRLKPLQADVTDSQDWVVVFVSQVVPNDLLRRGDIISISEQVPLENGRPFFMDAHGIWLSEGESEQIDAGVSLVEIKWDTQTPPKFAPY